MPTVMMHRGFKVFINWDDHNPPHFHVEYGGDEMLHMEMRRIVDAEPMAGDLPAKQKKMILGWAVLRHDELMENWKLAEQKKELFQIDPMR